MDHIVGSNDDGPYIYIQVPAAMDAQGCQVPGCNLLAHRRCACDDCGVNGPLLCYEHTRPAAVTGCELVRQPLMEQPGGISDASAEGESSGEESALDENSAPEEGPEVPDNKSVAKAIAKHRMKAPCGPKCYHQCTLHFSLEDRAKIHRDYWSKTSVQRRQFNMDYVTKKHTARKTTGAKPSRRNHTLVYQLKLSSELGGGPRQVCQKFFSATLGLSANNTAILKAVSSIEEMGEMAAAADRRGTAAPKHKLSNEQLQLISDHVMSFRPKAHHYRRKHAPNRLYLPSDITIRDMYNRFLEDNPGVKISYSSYHRAVAEKNISFTRLGNEECDVCKAAALHVVRFHSLTSKKPEPSTCDECFRQQKHEEKYRRTRQLYEADSEKILEDGEVIVSADMQKASGVASIRIASVSLKIVRDGVTYLEQYIDHSIARPSYAIYVPIIEIVWASEALPQSPDSNFWYSDVF